MSQIKYAVYEKETMRESLISDGMTFVVLLFLIWFSNNVEADFWTLVCFVMLIVWLTIKLPMETNRVSKFSTKNEAVDWANALPSDGQDKTNV